MHTHIHEPISIRMLKLKFKTTRSQQRYMNDVLNSTSTRIELEAEIVIAQGERNPLDNAELPNVSETNSYTLQNFKISNFVIKQLILK